MIAQIALIVYINKHYCLSILHIYNSAKPHQQIMSPSAHRKEAPKVSVSDAEPCCHTWHQMEPNSCPIIEAANCANNTVSRNDRTINLNSGRNVKEPK